MNLFFKKLTGKLQSTARFEEYMFKVAADIERYRRVEQSKELAEYNELRVITESKEFVTKKTQLTTTKYKSTEFFLTLKEYNKLSKSRALKKALDTIAKAKADKLKEENPQAEVQEIKLIEVPQSMYDLQAHYQELKDKVATTEFQEQNSFWANNKRWLTTDEYKQECRFKELADNEDIKFFLAQDPKQIQTWESYKLTFKDEFDWKNINDSKWQAGFAAKAEPLKRHFSFTVAQQAYNKGKNIQTANSVLTIATKQEHVTAPAWDEKKGFVMKDFEYTSDVMQTAKTFSQKEGLFMAKVRCTGKVNQSLSLCTTNNSPVLALFSFAKNIAVGNISQELEKIKGISANDFYIYSIRWTKSEAIFYVNNIEVARTQTLPKDALYLFSGSFIHQNNHPTQGALDIDWIRVYTY